MCYDPWLADSLRPSEGARRKWCEGDYRGCPNYLVLQAYLPNPLSL
ncbi:MAG: hypothetical protein V3V62_00530 [bacterium]